MKTANKAEASKDAKALSVVTKIEKQSPAKQMPSAQADPSACPISSRSWMRSWNARCLRGNEAKDES
ncbi:MAG: hypothetical protein LC114_18055 [Bryobacterales bacterium]|nr:hypothetical protein [Bryobacterales bacterium]